MTECLGIYPGEMHKSPSFWRSRNLNSTTHNSPNKFSSSFMNKTGSINKSVKTEKSVSVSKKSVYDLKYYLQIYNKRLRTELISKNFDQSNTSTHLSVTSPSKGLKGSKLHNKKVFRKNKFVTEPQENQRIEPYFQEDKSQKVNVLMQRHNKPNLMYNLNLFRKKYTRGFHSEKNSTDNLKIKHPLPSHDEVEISNSKKSNLKGSQKTQKRLFTTGALTQRIQYSNFT